MNDDMEILEQEDIFVISQMYMGGGWNKFVKSQEHWWYNQKEAEEWLELQPEWFRRSNSIFKLRIGIIKIEKVIDKPSHL